MELQVFGREEHLGRLERFVGEIVEGPRALVIEGLPGIGKTTVWRTGVDAAAERDYHVLVCRPSEAEATLTYSGLADLLATVDRSYIEALPEPQRLAIDIALLNSEPTGRSPDPRTVFAAFGGVLKFLSDDRPVLVAIDDLQWLDSSSSRALDYVARRLADTAVGILSTVRPPMHQDLRDAEVLRLEALSTTALHRMISGRLGVSLPRPTVLRLHRTTEGNPFFALELARTLVAAGLPGAGDPWPVPDDLQDMVAARISRLPPLIRSALLTAAASSQPTITDLSATAIRTAVRAEVATVSEHGRVRFAHPLIAAAVYSSASPEERRKTHSALAAAATDTEEKARHRALACEGADDEVARLLDHAATQAHARGAPDVAAELQDRAIALTPRDRSGKALERRVAAAEYCLRAGDLVRAHALLTESLPRLNGLPVESQALRLLGEVCYRLRYLDEAIEHLREAIDAAAGAPDAVARAELDLAYVLIYSFGSFEAAHDAASHALAEAETLGDNALLASALASAAVTNQILGYGLNEEMLAGALTLEDHAQTGPVEQRPSFIAGWAFLTGDQLDRARTVFDSLREQLVQRGADSDLPDLLAVLALLECLAGNLVRAADLADEGYELARQESSETLSAMTRAMRALVDAHAGRVDETRAAAAEAIALAARSGWQFATFWATSALAHLELALGNDEAVVATLTRSIALVEADGIGEPSRRLFLPDAIEALIHLGDLERADMLTQQLERRGRELNRRWAIVAGGRCRALLLAASGDVSAALEHIASVLGPESSFPMPLELARTLIVKGQLERRRKQRGAAAVSLRHALAICEEIGATLWAEQARSELARTGTVRGASELTPSETRVAELAASGLTNREIAATAFMSQKTVEANLSRIYRKLGIRSRAELGLRLADSEAQSAQPGPR